MNTPPFTPGSPAAQGYRMPAEWEPHRGTWISWPHNPDTWHHGTLPAAEATMAHIVAQLSEGEAVHINALDADHATRIRRLLTRHGANLGAVVCHPFRTNDAWCRDHSASFIVRDGDAPLAAVNWGFNAWGGKYPPFDADDAIPPQQAEALHVPLFQGGMILEGGAIEPNGAGTLLTTEDCLLAPTRNPNLDRAAIEHRLHDALDVHHILWLRGDLPGDDTDGHIDNIARFVDPTTIVAVYDSHNASLVETHERLRFACSANDEAFEVHQLPLPEPVVFNSEVLPASYANFYIGNHVVLVPTYACSNDAIAIDLLSHCFPNRRVVGVDARALIVGLGSIHCLTHQVPA
ncbi:MAG: agmatine deiminase family protein [Rhodothermales bacterium]